MAKIYNTIGMGGTFDHFHDGHKQFIDFAATLGRNLHIGVTHPKLTMHKPYSYLIESPEKRVKMVKQHCQHNRISCKVMELNDVYGPTLQSEPIEALVVTQETLAGARKINETRSKMGLPELTVHVAPLLPNQLGQPLHSEQIRAGWANRTGVVYPLLFKNDFVFSEEQRQFFRDPLDSLVKSPTLETQSVVCMVGDICLENAITNDWMYDIGIFDGKQQREEHFSAAINNQKVDRIITNPAGTITNELVTQLQEILKAEHPAQTHIKIDGEEDLATIALVLLLPLDSLVYYGQPNQGMVEVHVTEQLKEKVFHVLTS